METPAPPAAPAAPAAAGTYTEQWFARPFRDLNTWKFADPPFPVEGNKVTPYIRVPDYYAALGATVRAARANQSDFIYIAGWEFDLDTVVDPPGASTRQTLRELFTAAAKNGVAIRVLLDSTVNAAANEAVARDVEKLGGGAILDPFHLLTGSQHQKFVVARTGEGVVAYCGGSDIANHRLGREGLRGPPPTEEEIKKNPGLRELAVAPWHDVQVKVEGAAVADLWNSFARRWYELFLTSSRLANAVMGGPGTALFPVKIYGATQIYFVQPPDTQRQAGNLAVQVIRTYANSRHRRETDKFILPPGKPGYDFAPNGDMSYYDALIQAIGKARSTIYLEDQYLVNVMAMGNKAPVTSALKQVVNSPSFKKMVILVAGTGTIQGELYQAASRRAQFIRQLDLQDPSKVSVYAYGGDANSPWWFHAKTWIFDDTFAIVGSANCNRRSYSTDAEIGVAIIERNPEPSKIPFAKRLRMDLWLKHLNAQKAGSTGGTTYKDADVADFASAAPLFDKAPLLWKPDFLGDTTPDIPLTESEIAKNVLPKFGASVSAGLKVLIQNLPRDTAWGFVDPDGS